MLLQERCNPRASGQVVAIGDNHHTTYATTSDRRYFRSEYVPRSNTKQVPLDTNRLPLASGYGGDYTRVLQHSCWRSDQSIGTNSQLGCIDEFVAADRDRVLFLKRFWTAQWYELAAR